MVYNIIVTSLSELIYFNPSEPTEGDIVFASMDKSSNIFGHLSCGIFRLLDGFATSGETHDGLFIIQSLALSDMYWKRITKGVPKVYSSGILTLAQNDEFTLTHPADSDYARYPEVIKYVLNSDNVTLNRSNISGSICIDATGYYYPFDLVNNANDAISLAPKYNLVEDQDISHSYDVTAYSEWNEPGKVRLQKDGRIYASAEINDTSISYSESGGTWSLNTYYSDFDCTLFFTMTADSKNGVMRVWKPCGGYAPVGYVSYIYEESGGSWGESLCIAIPEPPEVPESGNEDNWWSGMMEGTFLPEDDEDLFITRDWPPFWSWYSYEVNAKEGIVLSDPYSLSYTLDRYLKSRGQIYEWLFCKSSVLYHDRWETWRTDADLIVTKMDDDGYENVLADIQGEVLYHGVDSYNSVIAFTENKGPLYATFTLSGDKVSSVSGKTFMYYNIVVGSESQQTGNIYFDTADSRILDDGTFVREGEFWKADGTSFMAPLVHGWDLNDQTGLIDCTNEYRTNYLGALPNNKFVLQSVQDLSQISICHLAAASPAQYKSHALVFSNFFENAESITSVDITGSEPSGSSLYFLIRDDSNNLWKWDTTSWELASGYTDGNTISEWEGSADWSLLASDLVTDINTVDIIVAMITDDGSITPLLEDIVINYSKGTDYQLRMQYVHGAAAETEVTLVSTTQTKIKNITASTINVGLKVYIMD